MMKIVITDCDHGSIDEELAVAANRGIDLELAQCHTEAEVIEAAIGADAIVVQYAPITKDVMAALPTLRAIGRYGVGVDTVDVAAATARKIAVCNVPDYGTEDVSDHAIALAMSLVRGVVQLDHALRQGRTDLNEVKPLNRTVNSVFGVVGLGRIGSATARKAKALGFRVLGSDPNPNAVARLGDLVEVVSLNELLADSDIVSLHVPLDEATTHLINADSLALMKPTAGLVNTCRGGVVDTAALAVALSNGWLKRAGLDVFETEPLPVTSPLVSLPNTVLTPHAAWYSEQSYNELKQRAIGNVADVCDGLRPRDLLNPEVMS